MTSVRRAAFLCLVLCPWPALCAAGPVVLSEVHYHPPASEGELLEFVEVHNLDTERIDISGWRLEGAVRFTFPSGAVLEPGAYALVCRDSQAFRAQITGAVPIIFGSYEGALQNSGDSVELVESWGAFVDAVPYDDRRPWPEEADGQGRSLQRLCLTASGSDPLNWTGSNPPTPGAPNPTPHCPPEYRVPQIVISEIHYHPYLGTVEHPANEDGEDVEFVEIHNPGAETVVLDGWSFSDGIEFTFPAGTSIEPGAYLAVSRNEVKVREKYGISNVLGNFTGKLSNSGERVALADARGNYVDSVNYSQTGEWPYAADGGGHSLERVVLTLPGYDPANWAVSLPVTTAFRHREGKGGVTQFLSTKFILSIEGAGEMLVDNVFLADESEPEPRPNLLSNSTFDAGIEGWTAKGVASGSAFAPGAGVEGSGALRLASSGNCPGGECGESNGVSQPVAGLKTGHTYVVTVDFKYVRGSPRFRAGLFRGACVDAADFETPGAANAMASPVLPNYISNVHRHPIEPTSQDPTWITALVRLASTAQVNLSYVARDQNATLSEGKVTMVDDGNHHDGRAADGVFGVELPPFPHNTQVRFRIAATADGSTAESPRPRFPEAPLPEEAWGYYVNDLQVDTPLPLYHVLIPGVNATIPQDINDKLDCWTLKSASFAYQGDLYPEIKIRFRGNTACYIQKRNLKLDFNKIAPFKGLNKMNLNGLWTDKGLVREHLAWEFFREIGAPYMETEFVRVHLNGYYHGLFMYLEHPDSRFLSRMGLASDANLYKAKQPSGAGGNEPPIGVELWPTEGQYRNNWEREVNENGDFSDLVEFVGAMHADGKKPEGPSSEFWSKRSFEEMIIGYQLGQVVLNNIDSFAKNHFLYHDVVQDRWGFITWDMDLVFGKYFDRGAVQFPERPVGTLNDIMLGDISGDLTPWFAATVNGEMLLNWLVDFFFRAGGKYYQRAYLTRLWDILQEKYSNEAYDPRLDSLAAFLLEEEADDYERWGRYVSNVPGFPDTMLPREGEEKGNIQIIKEQISLHSRFLRTYIEGWYGDITAHPTVKITEIMYLPENGNDQLEFLELLNTSGSELDVSGWSVDAIRFVFPAGAIVPPDATFIVAKSPPAFKARYSDKQLPRVFGPYDGKLANEGEEVRLLDRGLDAYPATIDYVRYENSSPWPAVLPGHSIELMDVGPEADNDLPERWIGSAAAGGTPWAAGGQTFVRGDTKGDGDVNLTDAVSTLDYLFRGGAPPACEDAADADDNGRVDISDAIYTLNFLFLGGPALPPPSSVAGLDPTFDGLTCTG